MVGRDILSVRNHTPPQVEHVSIHVTPENLKKGTADLYVTKSQENPYKGI
jgi:hypothetical protein